MKKLLKLLIIISIFFINISNLEAEEATHEFRKRRFENVYAVYDGPDRIRLFYGQVYIVDDLQAFCIEPGLPIDVNKYFSTNDYQITGLSKETFEKIKLISYYGFKYQNYNHATDKFYIATQELIWETASGREVYWVSEENKDGPRINLDSELTTINNLVNTHYTVPSFANKEYTIILGESLKLTDTSNVLPRFKITNTSLENVKQDDNTLLITPKDVSESGDINLETNLYTDLEPIIYYNGNNQKLLSIKGKVPPAKAKITIKVIDKPKLKVNKIDSMTNEHIKIKGIKFKIKNLTTNEYLCENADCIYETDDFGIFITNDKLDYGDYQLEELDQIIDGYLWNKEPLKFTVDKNSSYPDNYLTINFKNTPVTGSLELTKVGEKPIFKDNLITFEEIKLNNVVFNLYSSDHKFINTYKTNDGILLIKDLPIGSYYLKEVLTESSHLLVDKPIEFTIDYQDQYTQNVIKKLTIKNYLKKGILKFTKTDFKTGELLPNTLIEIYNDKDELIYEDYTNESGEIILEGLPIGKYYLKESIAPDGYELSNEIIRFEIKDNDEIINANMENIKIKVPSTHLDNSHILSIISVVLAVFGGFLFIHEKK